MELFLEIWDTVCCLLLCQIRHTFHLSLFRLSHVLPNSKAGAEIIGQNMRGGDSAALNVPRSEVPNLPGWQQSCHVLWIPKNYHPLRILRIHSSCACPFFNVIQWYQVFDFWRPLEAMIPGRRVEVPGPGHRMPGLERHHLGDLDDALGPMTSHDLSLLFKHFLTILEGIEGYNSISVLIKNVFWTGARPFLAFATSETSLMPQKFSRTQSMKESFSKKTSQLSFNLLPLVWSRHLMSTRHWVQDQVMVFVNRIASVIHSCVNEFFGNPNKNIGGRLR